jgi:hypothetical protein
MKMSALRAAKRISAGIQQGKSAQSRSLWNPVKLSWKRPDRLITTCRACCTLPAARSVWSPHLHLHFNLIEKADDQRRHFQMKSLTAASIAGRQGYDLLMKRSRLHVTNLWHQLFNTNKTYFQLYGRSKEMLGMTSVIGVQTVASRAERRFLSIMKLSSPSIDESVSGGGYGVNRAIDLMRRPSSPPIWQWRTAGQRVPQEWQMDSLGSPRSRASGRPAAPIGRQKLELVWPARAKINFGAGTERVGESVTHSQMATARLSPVSPINSAVPAQFREAPPVSPPMILDPALVDRLAEDVIRRVERHVRIERERRGV